MINIRPVGIYNCRFTFKCTLLLSYQLKWTPDFVFKSLNTNNLLTCNQINQSILNHKFTIQHPKRSILHDLFTTILQHQANTCVKGRQPYAALVSIFKWRQRIGFADCLFNAAQIINWFAIWFLWSPVRISIKSRCLFAAANSHFIRLI